MLPAERTALYSALATLAPGTTIIECGCYDGETTRTILAGLKQPPAAYFAFESDPRNVIRVLRANIEGVELVEAAIGVQDGIGEMWLSTNGGGKGEVTGASTLRDPAVHRTLHPGTTYPLTTTVRVVSLDSFTLARGIGEVGLLFSDIEGSERDLVEGGRETLARTRWWWTEAWDETRTPMPYAGMWSKQEIIRQMPGWEVAAEFEWDMLLRNTAFTT